MLKSFQIGNIRAQGGLKKNSKSKRIVIISFFVSATELLHEQEKGKDFHFTSPVAARATEHVQLVKEAIGIRTNG